MTLVHLCSPVPILCVVEAGGAGTLFETPVAAGYRFSTFIIHSVQLTPVTEYFEVDSVGRIVATGMDHADLGWGLPSTVDGSTEVAGDVIRVRGYQVILPELRFRVSYINRPRLVFETDHKELSLACLVPDGATVIVRVEFRPRYACYFGGGNDATVPVAEEAAP